MSRPDWRAALLAVALLQAGWAQAAPLSLDQALDLAAQRSMSAASARAASRSAAEMARAAGQLPDPMLSLSVENLPVTGADRFSTTAESMTMKRIGVAQEWVSPEKRSARQAAVQAMAQRETAGAEAALAETRVQTALAYLDAWYAAQAVTLTEQALRYAREQLETGKARAASPGGSAADALALAAALGQADDEVQALRQQASVAEVALSRWTGVRGSTLTEPKLPELPDNAAYVSRHPVVTQRQSDIEVADRDAVATRLNRRPNWSWEVMYGQRQGFSDLVSVGVRIPLPVAPESRQDRETAAKYALVDKARSELAEAERAAAAEFDTAATDVERLRQRIERYRAAVLVPSRQRVEAVLAAYGSNQAGLPMVFEARNAELDAQRKLLELQRDLAKAHAQLVFKPIAQGDAQ